MGAFSLIVVINLLNRSDMVLFSWNPGGTHAANVKDGTISVRTVADFHLLNLEALEELDRLDCEIYEELQIKALLDSSTRELASTIEELEKRLEEIENEGSEWKTRYSNQNELNQMLERQVVILANQIEDTKMLLKDERFGTEHQNGAKGESEAGNRNTRGRAAN